MALNYDVPLGWFLRALHGWGSNFMVALVVVHMIQVFLFGAYKYPRELTWIVGVFLLLVTLGMAFTGPGPALRPGRLLGTRHRRVDRRARRRSSGRQLVHLLLGGPIIAGATLSRFFALHVFVIPGLLIALVGLHLLLVLKLGINEWPMPGRLVRRETYREEYEALVRADGVPFFPDAAKRDLVFGGRDHPGVDRVRGGLRPDRPERPAGPDDHRRRCPRRTSSSSGSSRRWRSCPRTSRRRSC